MKPLVNFRLTEDTLLTVLKFKLYNLLHHTENRKVLKIEYFSPSIINEGHVKFTTLR